MLIHVMLVFAVLGTEPRTLHIPSKYLIQSYIPNSLTIYFIQMNQKLKAMRRDPISFRLIAPKRTSLRHWDL